MHDLSRNGDVTIVGSQLYELFEHLSATQRRQLKPFLGSPYFNQRQDVRTLFAYLRKSTKRKYPKLGRQEVFAALYPQRKYDDGRLNLVMHLLLEQIKRFLAQQEFEAQPQLRDLYQSRALRKLDATQSFEKTISKLQQAQQDQPYRNGGYHYLNFQIQQEEHEHTIRQRRAGRMNLEELIRELTVYYLADILRYSCTVVTAQRMGPEAYKLELLDEVLRYVQRSPVRHTPAVALYHRAYLLLLAADDDEDKGFEDFQALIEEHWQKFPPSEIHDIYLLAINYCIQRLNRGEHQYIGKALDMYKLGLARGVLLRHGQLSKFTYNNVLMLALASRELEWAERFLYDYKDKLSDAEQENIFQYNLAVYYFHKPDYDRALDLLRTVSFSDVLYNLNARSMLLRIYFERELFDVLEAHLDSFTTFVRRKELGYHRENYLNLIHFVRQLQRLPPGARSDRQALRERIYQTKAVAEKKWLLSQLQA